MAQRAQANAAPYQLVATHDCAILPEVIQVLEPVPEGAGLATASDLPASHAGFRPSALVLPP